MNPLHRHVGRAVWLGLAVASAAGCGGLEDPAQTDLAALPATLAIHQINVGWGSSVLVVGPDGTTVLLEAGDTGSGITQVVPFLQSHGIPPSAGLGYTIAGHQHCDHIGGMDEVVYAGYDVTVRNYYNGSSYSSSCVTSWNTAAATTTAGAPVRAVPGDQIALGDGARLTFVAVNGQIIGGGSVAVSDENDRSIAVLVQYGGFDYLWASDLGGGNVDSSCTGRTTSQSDVETSIMLAISPGGAVPLISAGGIDVLHVNHHGSESSTNKNWMNYSQPDLALIGTGAGQSSGWDLPRIDVVEHVLMGEAPCITAGPALALQTEEGAPAGALTSHAGYSVGNITVSTDGATGFSVSADGQVTQGPNEVAALGLPLGFALDDGTPGPDTLAPTTSITFPSGGATVSGVVSVSALASDNLGVAGVELWVDGVLHATDTSQPYGFTWDTTALAPGAHALRTEARDAAENRGVSPTVPVTVVVATPAQVVINEILANEPGSTTASEAVELVNVGGSAALIGGWRISDAVSARHTFAAGTQLIPGGAIVVFGGASSIPPGLANTVAASTGTLSLNNTGDTVVVDNGAGLTIDSFTYPSSLASADGVSMNRSPDASAAGTFVRHDTISALPASPGTRANGQPFATCSADTDCADANACNGAETCQAGSCAAGTPPSCDDGAVCTVDTCSPAVGCVYTPVADGSPCADGDACNGAETCVDGSCTPGAPLACDDGNACNGAETCSPATGCAAGTPIECGDGNLCNGSETCNPATGACQAGAPPSCDDGNVCTDDTCAPSTGCGHTNNLAPCTDGDSCTSPDACLAGACVPGPDTCGPDVVASDGFEANFTGGTGWAEASWRVAGDTVIRTNADGPHGGAKHVRERQGSGSLKRTVNLSGRTGARVHVWSKVVSFESSDLAYLKIRTSPSGTYEIRATFAPAQSDGLYHLYDVDIGACDGAAFCELYFDAAMNSTNDQWFVDDVEVVAF